METYGVHESITAGRRVLLRYSLHHVESGSILTLLFELVAPVLYIAPVAYELIIIIYFFSSSGGWGKIKLELTTLPRIFIRVVCRFNSVAFAAQR